MRRLLKKSAFCGAKIYSDFAVKRKVTIISFACRCVFMQKDVVNTPFSERKVCQRTLHRPTFLIRKVGKRISYRPHQFILAKAFEIPKDFSRKVLCVRVSRQTPQLIISPKIIIISPLQVRLYISFPPQARKVYCTKPKPYCRS